MTTTRPTSTSSPTPLLTAAGLENYEVSNWSLPGHECRHNQLYWRQQNYRGFGCAAHSHADGRRWWNVRTPERYIEAVERGASTEAAGESLDDETRRMEGLQLTLRTTDGVPVEALDVEGLDGLVEAAGRSLGADPFRTSVGQRDLHPIALIETVRHPPNRVAGHGSAGTVHCPAGV